MLPVTHFQLIQLIQKINYYVQMILHLVNIKLWLATVSLDQTVVAFLLAKTTPQSKLLCLMFKISPLTRIICKVDVKFQPQISNGCWVSSKLWQGCLYHPIMPPSTLQKVLLTSRPFHSNLESSSHSLSAI